MSEILPLLTLAWCGYILFLFLCKRWTLGRPMRSLSAEIYRFRSRVPEDRQVDSETLAEVSVLFEDCPVLEECWQQYLRAASSLTARRLPPVTRFFSYQHLIEERGLRRDNETMPSAFTGLGILGTFVGIVLGLYEMNVSDAVAIRGSISLLISGMKTAFLTSIAGVFFSLLWTACDQRLLSRTRKELECLHDTLSRLVRSPSEWELLEELTAVQKEHRDTLKSFMTDTLVPQIFSGFREVMNETLSPQLSRTADLFEKVTTAGAEVQVEGMGNMVRLFVDSLNQLLKEQIHELTQCIRETIAWQKQVHNEMQELSRGLSEAVLDVRDTLAQTADLVQDLSTEGQQLKHIIADLDPIHERFTLLLGRLGGIIESISAASEETDSNLRQLAEASRDAVETSEKQIAVVMEQLDDMRAFWREAADEMRSLSQGITSGVEVFTQQLHQGLEYSFEQYDKALSTAIDRLRGAISNMGDGLEDLPDLMDRIGDRLGKLSSSVEAATRILGEVAVAADSLSHQTSREGARQR